jgi:hypothetical protein
MEFRLIIMRFYLIDKLHYFGTVKFKHVSEETLTSEWITASGHNSISVERGSDSIIVIKT